MISPWKVGGVLVGLSGAGVLAWWLLTRDQTNDAKPGPAAPDTSSNGWAGSQRVAERAISTATTLGARVTSKKRDDSATLAAGSTKGSDHHVGNLTAYAIDFGVRSDLALGDKVFEAIRQLYGIQARPGSYTRYEITDGGERFSIQLLWRVKDHFDHVHLGVKRVGALGVAGLAGITQPRARGGIVIDGPWLRYT